jgi:acetyl-CoA carboxylase carboxyltransferase component
VSEELQASAAPSTSTGPGQGHPELAEIRARIEQGGAAKYHQSAAAAGKLFARDRIALLVDDGTFTEDGRYANAGAAAGDLPADGVITRTPPPPAPGRGR